MATDLPDLDGLIDEKIGQLIKTHFDGREPANIPHLAPEEPPQKEMAPEGRVMVQFFDGKTTKSKKKSSWFGQGKSEDSDHRLWESWVLHVKCLPLASEGSGNEIAMSKGSFEDNLHKIIDIVDTHKEHIPPITSLESSPFPYTIDVDHQYEASESWGNYIKKILD